jgi:hypothetical protein
MHCHGEEPNQKITFEAEIGPTGPRCDLTFEPTGSGARETFHGGAHPRGLFVPLAPDFNRLGQQVWSQRLERIRYGLESVT